MPVLIANLGQSPIISHSLEMGSYRLRLRKPGHHEVLYPVCIGRGEHWDGVDAFFAKYEGKAPGQKKKEVGESVPFGRMGTADDLTGMAIFLATDEYPPAARTVNSAAHTAPWTDAKIPRAPARATATRLCTATWTRRCAPT